MDSAAPADLPPISHQLHGIAVRHWGSADYAKTYAAMRSWTAARVPSTPDEFWLVEHPAVYTQGISGSAAHLIDPGSIPVVQTDRGGQVTFHGPGQVVAYPLVDLRRLGIYVKEFVYRLEAAAIQALAAVGVEAFRVPGAPGLYVHLAGPRGAALPPGPRIHPFEGLGKIVALGIKVSRHCAYHGLALNVCMDLSPYQGINPCGYAGLSTVDLATLGVHADPRAMADLLAERLAAHLSP